MPELPEVETLRRSLQRPLLKRTIASATLHRRDILILPGDPAGGFSRSRSRKRPLRVRPEHLLVGGTIIELRRRGKQMAVVAGDGRALVVHLGMTGQLLRTKPKDHTHISWTLDDGSQLFFRDPRRFGGLWFIPGVSTLDATRWADLGPDALTITAEGLAEAAAGSKRAVKALLLDQQALAGVGNIYADEALFLSRISPRRRADRLSAAQCQALALAIRDTLSAAIKARGSTLRDYRDAAGEPGEAQNGHRVYGRAGQPCLTCGKPLATAIMAQRTTVWCRGCQA